jgi:hypothetical protein
VVLPVGWSTLGQISAAESHHDSPIGVLTRDADVVMLERGDPELADEALRLAIITYGQLLELSEKTVKHGLSARVLQLVKHVLSGADESR